MAEALWDLEDKLKISNQGALLILASACFAIAAICTFLVVLKMKERKKRNRIAHQEGDIGDDGEAETSTMACSRLGSGSGCSWISVKHVLMGSVLWSRACKWKENVASQRKLLGLERDGGVEIGRQSHNSVSAVWQRPILRGEKCELPRFSGLILYDDKGRLLRHSHGQETHCNASLNQDNEIVTVRTTLRDLLSS
ncbi:hypothetical protein QN277_002471 [Acacia crassicarpa]|uniref:Transmembrane protein n=1 Tax=Acacia crassicarpa TaxID=499986 RepID=A0AAE1THW6_9FABA|nr:hypothetical protein QN277_002471 [Acacia crassicarpa]